MKWFAALGLTCFVIGFTTPLSAQQNRFDVDVTVRGDRGSVAGSPSDTFFSFSSPVGIPGVSLPPDTYIFRQVTPSVVQVLSEDRSMVYGMFFVTPAWRAEASDEYAVTLERIDEKAPPRITAVFQPSQSTGYHPMYPETTAGD
jgi:hypothetical protein